VLPWRRPARCTSGMVWTSSLNNRKPISYPASNEQSQLSGSPISRQKKSPTFPRLFQTKLQTTYRTNAHLLIQNLLVKNFGARFSNWLKSTQNAEHQICKNALKYDYSTSRVKLRCSEHVSMHITVSLPEHCQGVTIKFPDYTNSLTLQNSLTFPRFQKFHKSGNPELYHNCMFIMHK